MFEFLQGLVGIILMLAYLVFVVLYLYAALSDHEHSDHFMLKPFVVFLVLMITALLLGIMLRGCGINIFEGDPPYNGGPY